MRTLLFPWILLATLFAPKTSNWAGSRDAIKEYVAEQEAHHREALGLDDPAATVAELALALGLAGQCIARENASQARVPFGKHQKQHQHFLAALGGIRFFVENQLDTAEQGFLDELNEAFNVWLTHTYHQRKHSATGQTPLSRFTFL